MDATSSADEIDISNKQSAQLILTFLEKYLPQSLSVWQFLNYIQQNLLKTDYLWPHQLFVNDQDDIRCVLFIWCTKGFKTNYHLLTEEEKLSSRHVTFFCDINADHLFIPLIEQCVPWSTIKSITFYAIEHRFSSIIESFVSDHHLGTCRPNQFQLMKLDKKTFLEKTKEMTKSCPSDTVIRPLSVSDAFIINDLWTYKSAWTLFQIIYEIGHFPAYGAYRNEELISWVLTKYDGSIGTVFTKPEARGLGLATLLVVYVASKLFEQYEQTFCFVGHDNIASLRTFDKLGYRRASDVDWLFFTSK